MISLRKISTKIILITTMLFLLFFVIPAFFLFKQSKSIIQEYALNFNQNAINAEALNFEKTFFVIRQDLLTLSSNSVFHELFEVEADTSNQETHDFSKWNNALGQIFLKIAEERKNYYQIRYIDEKGMEKVRINYINGKGEIVNAEKLQYKGDRPYFTEALQLEEGQIYVSKIELNKEGTPPTIEIPYQPVIRYALPLFNEKKERKGILIINVYLNEILKNLKTNTDSFRSISIVDQDGYYIKNNDSQKQWGGKNNLDSGFSFKSDYPNNLFSYIKHYDGYLNFGTNIYFFKKVILSSVNDNVFLVVFYDTSSTLLFKNINFTFYFILALVIFIFIFFLFLYTIFINYSFKPLRKLAYGAEEAGKGNLTYQIPITTNDEIGYVAKIFNETIVKLKDLYDNLENKVKARTKEIEQAKEEISRVSNRLKMATQVAKIGVWEWDISENRLIWDQQMFDLYQTSPKEFPNNYEGWKKFLHPDETDEIEKKIKKYISTKNEFDFEFRVIMPNKSIRFMKAYAAVRRNKNNAPYKVIGVNIDITESKELDNAKNEFVSFVSHQLRSPLAATNWQLDFVLEGSLGKVNKKIREYLEDVFDSNKKMISLVNGLLNVSRIELGVFSINPELIDLVKITGDTINESRKDIKDKKIKFIKKYSRGLHQVKADANLIQIVIQNFVTNAIKYTPAKGEIHLDIKKDKNSILISVKDNGMGIPKDEQEKIYSKMYRTKSVQKSGIKGTGLGLYIVRAIAQFSGGKTWFESEDGQGSTFYFSFPVKGMKARKGRISLS